MKAKLENRNVIRARLMILAYEVDQMRLDLDLIGLRFKKTGDVLARMIEDLKEADDEAL